MQNNSYYLFGNQYQPKTIAEYQFLRMQQMYHHQRMQIPVQNLATTSFGYRPNTQMEAYYTPFASSQYPFARQMPFFNRNYQAYGHIPNHQIRFNPPNFIQYQNQHNYSQSIAPSSNKYRQLQQQPICVSSDDSNILEDQKKQQKNQNSTHQSLSKQKVLKLQNLPLRSQFNEKIQEDCKKMKIEQKHHFQMNKQKSQICSTNQNKKNLKNQSKNNTNLLSFKQIVQKEKAYKFQKKAQKRQKQQEKTKKIVKTSQRKLQQKAKSTFTPIERPRRNLIKRKPGQEIQTEPRHKEPAPKIMIGQQYQAQLPQFFINKRDQIIWMQLKKRNLLQRLQDPDKKLIPVLKSTYFISNEDAKIIQENY